MKNVLKFPKLRFWGNQTPKIKFINEADFWKNELLSKLGLTNMSLSDSLGSSDREEILRRQSIMKILFENPKLRKFIKDGIKTKIPHQGQEFLDEFSPEKPMSSFAQKVNDFIYHLEDVNTKKPLSEDTKILFSFLKETISEFIKSENHFGEKVAEEVQKASQLHGRLTLQVLTSSEEGSKEKVYGFDYSNLEGEGYGFRHFSFKLSNRFKLILDKGNEYWVENSNLRTFLIVLSVIFFPVGLYVLWHNHRLMKLSFKPMIIEGVPSVIKMDIVHTLRKILIKEPYEKYSNLLKRQEVLLSQGKIDEASEIEIPDIFPDINNQADTFIELYYNYGREGLGIKILRVYCKPIDRNFIDSHAPSYETDFDGYSAKYIEKIKEQSRKLENDSIQQVFQYSNVSKILEYIQKNHEDLLGVKESRFIQSIKTDKEFKYYTVEEIKNLPHLMEIHKKVNDYRLFVSGFMNELLTLVELLEEVIERSQEWNIPLEFPTILSEDNHSIGFETIYPIHLIGRTASNNSLVEAKHLIPITSLPPLNGQMVGLTGQNGGGKTATINELSYLIFLAQSGLPVFGKGVHLNVKKTIGLVFNSRGEGSQLQTFLNKSLNVLKAIENLAPNTTVVMLDELGSGAQNQDGIELGKKILEALHKSGVSTIYNTQLPEVAEYSAEQLGAICFKFTLDHQVRKGIGLGGASLLAKEIGIDKYFSQS